MKKRRTFCAGCANLFFVGGKTKPLCVATAEFVGGPLRRKIEVISVMSAEMRNIKNDCGRRISVSIRAWEIKRWLLWRLSDGNEKRVGEVGLRDYSVEKEHNRKREILGTGEAGGGTEREEEDDLDDDIYEKEEGDYPDPKGEEDKAAREEVEEEDICEEAGEEEAGVFPNGGADDHDKSGASGKV